MASQDPRIESLLAANRKIAETWPAIPHMKELGAQIVKNGGAIVILTCIDPRCIPEQYFGLDAGVGVIRNAGGRVTQDAINSLTVLLSLVGSMTVLVVHHTDCGTTHLTDEGIREIAKKRTPEAAAEVDAVKTYGCSDAAYFDRTVLEDVRALKEAKVLAGVEVQGFKLDTFTGLVTEVSGS